MAGQALVLGAEQRSGYGYGSGDGSGDGSGYGYGAGSGSGSGYGYGYGETLLASYLSHPLVTNLTSQGHDITLGWWRSDTSGYSANGGSTRIGTAAPGADQQVTGPLRLCTSRALHACASPREWRGDRWWIVALIGPVEREGSKAGALRRVIIAEAAA